MTRDAEMARALERALRRSLDAVTPRELGPLGQSAQIEAKRLHALGVRPTFEFRPRSARVGMTQPQGSQP